MVLQFFIGTEMLLVMVVMMAVGVLLVAVAAALSGWQELRRSLGHVVAGLAAAAAVAGALLVYPTWFALKGPAHLSGRIWPFAEALSLPVKDFFLPNQHPVGSGDYRFNHILGGYQGVVISYRYLGIGIAVVALGGLVVYRRDRRLWLFGAIAVVSGILSLGAELGTWTPWLLIAHEPVLENILPGRFDLVTDLALAVMVGLTVDHVFRSAAEWRARTAGRQRETGVTTQPLPPWSVAAIAWGVAALALVPPAAYVARTLPFTTRPVVVPTWFRTVAPHLSQQDVLLTLPAAFSYTKSPIAWQAVNDMSYSMVGLGGPAAELSRAGPERAGQAVLMTISGFPHDPGASLSTASVHRGPPRAGRMGRHVGRASRPARPARLLVRKVGLGDGCSRPGHGGDRHPSRPPGRCLGVERRRSCRRSGRTGGNLLTDCIRGLPSRGGAAVDAATRCALGAG